MLNLREEQIRLRPPVEYIGHQVVVYRDPSRRRPKQVHTGPVRITEFAQTIVVAYNGRTDCLEADKWKMDLRGDLLTLEAAVKQPLHKPVRLDFHLTL